VQKIDKPLAKLNKRWRRLKLVEIEMRKGPSQKNTKEIQRIFGDTSKTYILME
jgi:hypothetical protein